MDRDAFMLRYHDYAVHDADEAFRELDRVLPESRDLLPVVVLVQNRYTLMPLGAALFVERTHAGKIIPHPG